MKVKVEFEITVEKVENLPKKLFDSSHDGVVVAWKRGSSKSKSKKGETELGNLLLIQHLPAISSRKSSASIRPMSFGIASLPSLENSERSTIEDSYSSVWSKSQLFKFVATMEYSNKTKSFSSSKMLMAVKREYQEEKGKSKHHDKEKDADKSPRQSVAALSSSRVFSSSSTILLSPISTSPPIATVNSHGKRKLQKIAKVEINLADFAKHGNLAASKNFLCSYEKERRLKKKLNGSEFAPTIQMSIKAKWISVSGKKFCEQSDKTGEAIEIDGKLYFLGERLDDDMEEPTVAEATDFSQADNDSDDDEDEGNVFESEYEEEDRKRERKLTRAGPSLASMVRTIVQSKVKVEYEISLLKVESMPTSMNAKSFFVIWRRGKKKSGEFGKFNCNNGVIDFTIGDGNNKAVIPSTMYYDNKHQFHAKEMLLSLKFKGKKVTKTFGHVFINLGEFSITLPEETKTFTVTAPCTPSPVLSIKMRAKVIDKVEEKAKEKELLTEREKEKSTKIASSNTSKSVFGCTIREGLLVDGERKYCVSPLVTATVTEIEKRITTEGLFRVAGSFEDLEKLIALVDSGENLDILPQYNIHTISGVLKHYLRSLAEPVFPYSVYDALLQIKISDPVTDEEMAAIKQIVDQLHAANKSLLKYLCTFLAKVSTYSTENKMSVDNLSIIFGPSLIRPPPSHIAFNDPMINLEHSSKINAIMKALIEKHKKLLSEEIDFGPEDGLFADSDLKIQIAAKNRLIEHLRSNLQITSENLKRAEISLAEQEKKAEQYRLRAELAEAQLEQEIAINKFLVAPKDNITWAKDNANIMMPAHELAHILLMRYQKTGDQANLLNAINRISADISTNISNDNVYWLAAASALLYLMQKGAPQLFPGDISQTGPKDCQLQSNKLFKVVFECYQSLLNVAYQRMEDIAEVMVTDMSEMFDEPRSRFSMKMFAKVVTDGRDDEKKMDQVLGNLTDMFDTLANYHILPSIIGYFFERLFKVIDSISFNKLMQQRTLLTSKTSLVLKMRLSQFEHWASHLDTKYPIFDALKEFVYLPQVANVLLCFSNKHMFTSDKQLLDTFTALNARQLLVIFDAGAGAKVSREIKVIFDKLRTAKTQDLPLLVNLTSEVPELIVVSQH